MQLHQVAASRPVRDAAVQREAVFGLDADRRQQAALHGPGVARRVSTRRLGAGAAA